MTSASFIIGYRDGGMDRANALTKVRHHLRGYQVYVVDTDSDPFSRADAFNQGVANSTADVVVLHNPDVIIPHAQLDAAILLAELSGVTVYPFTSYYELTREATDRYLVGELGDAEAFHYQLVMGEECVGPCLAVRRTVYEKWGGMDERFTGWGYEDIAWDVTSRTLVGPALRIHGTCMHLWHPPALHSPHRPTDVTEQNMALCARYRRNDGHAPSILELLAERDALR